MPIIRKWTMPLPVRGQLAVLNLWKSICPPCPPIHWTQKCHLTKFFAQCQCWQWHLCQLTVLADSSSKLDPAPTAQVDPTRDPIAPIDQSKALNTWHTFWVWISHANWWHCQQQFSTPCVIPIFRSFRISKKNSHQTSLTIVRFSDFGRTLVF